MAIKSSCPGESPIEQESDRQVAVQLYLDFIARLFAEEILTQEGLGAEKELA